MSSLLILPPGIPFDAATISSTIDEADSTTSIWNTITGPRYLRSVATSAGGRYYNYDLGSSYATKGGIADFLVVARADINPLNDHYFQFSDNGSSWTNKTNGALSLTGPRSQDWITTFTATTAHRYWRISLWCASGAVKVSKIYFGQAINFASELATIEQDLRPPKAAWNAGSGAQRISQAGESVYSFIATWEGISESELQNFQNKVLRYAEINPVFLYTTANHDLLDNQRLIHCAITDVKIRRSGGVYDYWSLRVSFEEILG